ncbi:MAG: glycosyltransferase family 2 protein [Candidatus Omnitrophica bacterium]|nr:glycosyltransferase family 2 protein [Candidatus Omnitrophota bacterium]
MDKLKKVLVIIPNYNGGERILRCIKSVLQQSYPTIEAVVVDNASTDGSDVLVQKEFPAVRFIQNGYNAGWGIACNAGIHAVQSDYVALLNNDAYMDKNCIEEMVKVIEKNPDYGSCASRILLWDEPEKIEVCGLDIYRDGSSSGRGRLKPAETYMQEEEVFCANDCCCLYKRRMLEDIGDYDIDFFIYCDETEMGWRHQLAGWKCIYAPKAVAYHAHSAAAGSYSAFKAYHVERNRLYLCFKSFPIGMLLMSFFYSGYRFLYQWYMSSVEKKGALAHYRKEHSLLEGLGILMKAYVHAFMKLPVMWKKRKEIMRKKRISGKEINRLFQKFGITARQMASYE